ncbi:hypothetical protein KUV80_07890 [Fictibacillus nanhaiensis]|uniref:hypothetical protein n=1 Tax=Fictibacillus nanhaiensis TaxID=742169 RepID=UPI001C954A5C|nr:hypothetical protein [Fictibacillus nanhaiensis]MBY6036569.1 hypothetical protein [Fictibacillus nanhaiensis]
MRWGIGLLFVCGYILLDPSAKALSPTTMYPIQNISHYTPISTVIVNNESCNKQDPPR